MKGFLSFIPGNSFFHNLNPVTKLFYSMAICAGCFMSDKWQILLFLLAVGILSGIVSGICQRTFSLLKGLFKVSIFLVTLQILLIRTGNTIWTIPLVNLAITDNGINTSAVLVLKLSGATLPLALMLSVTKLQDLSNALVDKLRIPYKYAFTLTTAIKFIPVFAEEMAGIIEAFLRPSNEFGAAGGRVKPIHVPCIVPRRMLFNKRAMRGESPQPSLASDVAASC